eukprot:346553-Chlamydomonas_euryale.AAC.1
MRRACPPRPVSRHAPPRREMTGRPVRQDPLASEMRGSGLRPGAPLPLKCGSVGAASRGRTTGGKFLLGTEAGGFNPTQGAKSPCRIKILVFCCQYWQLSLRSRAYHLQAQLQGRVNAHSLMSVYAGFQASRGIQCRLTSC